MLREICFLIHLWQSKFLCVGSWILGEKKGTRLKNVGVKNFPNNFYWFSVFLTFYSAELKCDMNFAVYVPPQAASEKVPVLYWLSGNCKCLQLIYCYWDCAEQSPEALTSY